MTAAPADARCSGCGGERDRPGQRYCRACKRVADRRRARRLRRALEVCQRAGLAIPAEAAHEPENRPSVDVVPPERRDIAAPMAVTSKP